jgi:hypothetical protein
MFRRLEEAFQDHPEYVNKQNTYFDALPNMILSQTSGLKGFDTAIQSLDSRGTNYQRPPVKNPDNIFIQDTSPNLNNLSKQCASSSLDELISIKNPNAAIGCGWLYTPPNKNSPYPVVSQGFIGNPNAPLKGFNPPTHKQYFFDLQLAKKQILLDKCKALQTCSGVDDEIYRGTCGYCTDTNQGIPIDNGGRALYSDDSLGTCNVDSIVRTSSKCPPPASAAVGSGPEPIIDRTCEPINGRLTAACLYNQVISAGCNDKGTLATALANPSSASNYINSITSGDTVKIYNRVANPPLNLDIFAQGITTVESVLKEARQLVGNTKEPPRSALGSSARELCLQAGSIAAYDFCDDLQDSTPAPFDMRCLQKLFKKMGGQPTGSVYPTANTMALYNSMTSIGNVKQYINKLIEDMNSSDYATQKTAVKQFLGISLQNLIKRVPYRQGVEVIWFQAVSGKPNIIEGILRRTIEKDIVQSGSGPLPKYINPTSGSYVASGMIQMFDLRSNMDFSTKHRVNFNGGFFVATNQPANIAKTALNDAKDRDGLLADFRYQGTNTYTSNGCFKYFSGTPNITKLLYLNYWRNNNNIFQLSNVACKDTVPTFIPAYYSLTLDVKAPYLNFEVSPDGNTFDDTRNPGLFTNLIVQNGAPEFRNRSEERNSVPGRKGFVRISNKTSWIRLQNISYGAWGSVTFAFRLQSMPVKDTIFSFWSFNKNCILYLVPSGSSAQMRIRTNMTMDNAVSDIATNFNISIGKWYFLQAVNNGGGFDIKCDMIENIIKNNNYTTSPTIVKGISPITTTANNGLGIPGQTNCSVSVAEWLTGLPGYAQTLIFDLAWVHFYDHYDPDFVKDCKADWQFTQYPDSPNTYRTLS